MRRYMILVTALALGVSCSCRREVEKKVDPRQCDALYGELLDAYKAYGDSMARCTDTDTTGRAQALEERFERRIREIYWRYPMDLDSHLSEAQNDTLWRYAGRYIEMRRRHARPEMPDTTRQAEEKDSLGITLG